MAQHNNFMSPLARLDNAATAYTVPPLHVCSFQGVYDFLKAWAGCMDYWNGTVLNVAHGMIPVCMEFKHVLLQRPARRPLGRLHGDVVGPLPTALPPIKATYVPVITDDYSRYRAVALLATKAAIPYVFNPASIPATGTTFAPHMVRLARRR
jgi:hypothetical protein